MRASTDSAGPTGGPRAGAFVPFVDPALDAVEADVFWHPGAYSRVLSAYVSLSAMPGFSSLVSLRRLTYRKAILVLANGEQHLLLRDGRRAVQVRCIGDDLTRDPLAIGLLADEFPNVERKIRVLRRFAELYRGVNTDSTTAGWTPPAERLRNALIALDGSLAGATYREIGEVIYGQSFVAERWGRGQRNLKDQLIRAVRRGRQLMDGGYAELLL